MPNPQETSKSNARTKDVALETAAPFGHDEVASQIAKEALGDGAATEPIKKGSLASKDGAAHEENPKRTENSRKD